MTQQPPPAIHDARFVASATAVQGLPPPIYAELAFAGRSNVGKSSLINTLLGRRNLVRTSSTPGCTRGLNLFRVELSAGTFDLVDLPGYGYARRSKSERMSWGPMIEGYLQQRAGLRCVVLIIDVRRGLLEEDSQLLEFLQHIDREALLVATKLDKLPRNRRKPAMLAIERQAGRPVMAFSSSERLGRDELLRALLKRAALGAAVSP
ncbi:MAG: ribosome biogenesis GTP-binding protein YihA/YsxC [Myxococcales bacterium]|nr:ribosome biogenesis GTP-binding protein YihA/YsxC [Myxococcales bacterium]